MTQWLGDYKEDDTVHFLWGTNDGDGASITRATDGEVRVYKDNNAAQSTAGVTDTEDFDSLTGVHACTIDLSADAFYATGADYSVVLAGAVIDGETVNAVLAHFSIENRFNEVDVVKVDGTAVESTSGQLHVLDDEGNALANESKQDTIDTVVDAIKAVTDNLPDSGALNDLAAILADTGTSGVVLADGAVTAAKLGSACITAAKLDTGCITSDEMAATALTAIADAVMSRGVANVENSADADSLAALILSRLHAVISGLSLIIYKSDDSTIFDTKAVTKSGTADPITGVADP